MFVESVFALERAEANHVVAAPVRRGFPEAKGRGRAGEHARNCESD